MMVNNAEPVESEFVRLFEEEPIVVRSPGRVNLIGEHTDYNLGYVLPAAIDKAIYLAVAPREGRQCRLHALDVGEDVEFPIDALVHSPKRWPNYLMGVVDQFLRAGHAISGFNCVFGGNIPIGAGLSSSAAIEAGLAFALNRLFGLGIDPLSLVKMAQKAENEFVGVRCGIMDQFANIFGRENCVIRLDCRSLEYRYYPFEMPDVSIVLFDTGITHELASSEYNRRREECDAGVRIIQAHHPAVTALRDVTLGMLENHKESLTDIQYRRCRYVIEENLRVERACHYLEIADVAGFGKCMRETHRGLRDEYAVSCTELDYLVDLLERNDRVYGSRMMGGGFGGCTINLIANRELDSICSMVEEYYKRTFNIDLHTHVTSIGAGTSLAASKTCSEAQPRLAGSREPDGRGGLVRGS